MTSRFCLFFNKKNWRTSSFLWGYWYPCFGLLLTSPLGFKAKVGSLIRFAHHASGFCLKELCVSRNSVFFRRTNSKFTGRSDLSYFFQQSALVRNQCSNPSLYLVIADQWPSVRGGGGLAGGRGCLLGGGFLPGRQCLPGGVHPPVDRQTPVKT